MWIRCQDGKALINANEIWFCSPISGKATAPICGNNTSYDEAFTVLGYYTESQALKVLDMMQDKILEFEAIKIAGASTFSGYVGCVFQMPQPEEVE